MFFDPRALLLMIVLVGVTGWVTRGLLVTWYRLSREGRPSGDGMREMEERLKKVEAATSSLIIDVTGMREKERFMARLQAGVAPQEPQVRPEPAKSDELSPMVTQNIPVIPRAGRR